MRRISSIPSSRAWMRRRRADPVKRLTSGAPGASGPRVNTRTGRVTIRDCGIPPRYGGIYRIEARSDPQAVFRRVRRGPVAGDVGAAADPYPVMAHYVLDKADQRRGAPGMAGEPHVQSDRHHTRPVGALFVQQVEAVAQIG